MLTLIITSPLSLETCSTLELSFYKNKKFNPGSTLWVIQNPTSILVGNIFEIKNFSRKNEKLKKFQFLQCLKNIRDFFQVHWMNNCEMVDHEKVCRIALTQSVLRDRKNRFVL